MRRRDAWAGLALPVLAMSLWSDAAAQSTPSAEALAGARAALHACLDRAGAGPRGLSQIEQRCPDLSSALQAAGIRPLIIDSSRALVDRESLRQLAGLMHASAGPAPRVTALQPVLRGLHAAPAPPRSWWQRLWDWLVEHLAPGQSASDSPWLTGILRLLPRLQWLWTAITWGTLIAVPIAVVIIVMREVRAMGRPSADSPAASAAIEGTAVSQSRLALLRQAPLGERPAQLFAMLIGRLVAAGRLPPDRSLTHREIARRALLDDAEQRQLLESLARLAERQLYAGAVSTPAGVEGLLARGEDLYTTGWGRPAEQ
ncbi:MAG TPA: DUF4129 domain-containing protein [Steroidobacteraceae bacterium]|nr:DUF4129 domain-containing protein [Steroidobacteraceae bacterium]